MFKRQVTMAAVLAVGGLLGWLAASGRMGELFAQAPTPRPAPAEGTQLPKPDPAFKGKIGETYKDSTPNFPLLVNGQPAGERKVKRSLFRHGLEPFEIGRDSITPVNPAYHEKGEFEFTGKIRKVPFELSGK